MDALGSSQQVLDVRPQEPAEDEVAKLTKPEGHENPIKYPKYEVAQVDEDGLPQAPPDPDRILFKTENLAIRYIQAQQRAKFVGVVEIIFWQKGLESEAGEEVSHEDKVERGEVIRKIVVQ